MQALPFDEALVLEALRALSTDMANMIVAARRCAQVEVEAAATVPRVGGCQNLLLDDLTSDLVTGFTRCGPIPCNCSQAAFVWIALAVFVPRSSNVLHVIHLM